MRKNKSLDDIMKHKGNFRNLDEEQPITRPREICHKGAHIHPLLSPRIAPAGSCPSTLATLKFSHSNVLESSEETLASLLARGKCQVTKPSLRTHRGPPAPLHFILSSTQWLIGEIYEVQRSRV